VLGLRSRVILSFGVLSLTVALLVSLSAYLFARSYLVSQRESAGLTRAILDARAVAAALDEDVEPGDALALVPAVGGAQALARVDGTWYTRGAGASPPDLPAELISMAESDGAARQRFAIAQAPVFGVAVAQQDDLYIELIPLADLDSALRTAGWLIVAISALALAIGAALGAWAARRVLSPVQSLSSGAVRIAEGDLTARLQPTHDPDLEPLTTAFNDMADAVEQRIARERRFVANVSHELRSPVTAVVGTAELLDNHRGALPPRDAALVAQLVARARRLSRTLVDLLELGSPSGTHPLQAEAVDVAGIASSLLLERGIDVSLLHGDRPVIRTDARRVERVLSNLIDNATTHGGGVRAVVVERTVDAALVHVDDAGPGLPDDVEQLFEPFTRGAMPGTDEGAGLGLAIARECAEAIGGEVSPGVSPYGGMRMTLRVPTGESA
jgi:signal transduction histidine kinase